ncbi:MAG: hypothetical protein HFH41_13250 [Lachnospiraceae bacterium]|nr:hypothetical protein [Lachnospiraceae bacterium]
MKNVQEEINKIMVGDFSDNDLVDYLNSPLVLVKTNAMIAMLKKSNIDKKSIDKLIDISQNIQREPKVIGEWTTGHYAMAVLKLLGTKIADNAYHDNIKKMDMYTRDNIESLIKQIVDTNFCDNS